jgi:hypothetical protein
MSLNSVVIRRPGAAERIENFKRKAIAAQTMAHASAFFARATLEAYNVEHVDKQFVAAWQENARWWAHEARRYLGLLLLEKEYLE